MRFKHKLLSISIFLAATVLLAACGYNPETPVYDTADNPNGFPDKALSILNAMEQRQLNTLDTISTLFADLYMTYPDLLDNSDWQQVVDRLGLRFQYLAEKLRNSDDFNINDYSQLSDYYTLAAFARPADTSLMRLSQSFGCWRDVATQFPRLENAVGRSTMTLGEKIAVVRTLTYGDSTCRRFDYDYVLQPLFGDNPDVSGADILDQALLDFAGLPVKPDYQPLATFSSPRIDLVAMKITPEDSGRQDVQFFFVPRDTVTSDYRIAFWVNTSDDEGKVGETRFPFDFDPIVPSSHWQVNRAAAAHQIVAYKDKIERLSIGLYKSFGARLEFVPLLDTDSNLVRLRLDQ